MADLPFTPHDQVHRRGHYVVTAIAPAVAATVIALPAGMALQSAVMHAPASDQAFLPSVLRTPPSSLVHVYTPAGLILLALAGLAVTVAGALGPPHGQRCPGPRSRCTPNNRTTATLYRLNVGMPAWTGEAENQILRHPCGPCRLLNGGFRAGAAVRLGLDH